MAEPLMKSTMTVKKGSFVLSQTSKAQPSFNSASSSSLPLKRRVSCVLPQLLLPMACLLMQLQDVLLGVDSCCLIYTRETGAKVRWRLFCTAHNTFCWCSTCPASRTQWHWLQQQLLCADTLLAMHRNMS